MSDNPVQELIEAIRRVERHVAAVGREKALSELAQEFPEIGETLAAQALTSGNAVSLTTALGNLRAGETRRRFIAWAAALPE